jgi:FkbM family methyltransferase
MDNLIYYADRMVSVADPYVDDKFVQSHHRRLAPDEVEGLLLKFRKTSVDNKLLASLLLRLQEQSATEVVSVVDIGVFMGSFSNAVSLASKELAVPVSIDAWEANPQLISALIKNFRLYGSDVHLHWSGIGRERGVMELVVRPGVAIGASLAHTAERKLGDYFACSVDVTPLSDVLKDEAALGLVKIDIEGFEVPAFSSIVGDFNRLHNVFITEFEPKQAAQEVAPGKTFGDFLLEHFRLYNIGNWGWFSGAAAISSLQELVGVDLGNGGTNTDLLLVPRSFGYEPPGL